MKKILSIIGVALLVTVTHAQTNSAADTHAAIAATNSVTVSTPSPLTQVESGVTAGYQQLSQLSFTNGLVAGIFGIRHSGDYGGGIMARTANPQAVNVGFALAGIYEKVKDPVTLKSKSTLNFYDATVNISLNGTTVIPFLNYPLDYILESGPAANLKDPKTVYEQSLVGMEKTWHLGNPAAGDRAWAITIQAGEGHCSRWGNGFFQEVAGVITCKPHGW